MAEKQGPENSEGAQPQTNSASTNADVGIGGNVEGNVTVGNNNVVNNNIVNNYYQQEVKKNIEKHEPDYWALKHPYPMPKNFTGRIAERATLTHWLKEDSENSLFILRALGGFGKSALSWQWLTHDVDIKEYPKVLWWSFYEGDASFEHFIEETLKYLKLEVPQGQRPQVDELLKAMQGQKILLVMDGFERALRAYSSMNAAYQGDEEAKKNERACVNLNAEIFLKNVCSLPAMKGKVLMTTRITPHAVEPRGQILQGCREVELKAIHKDDAVKFFHAQGIHGTHAEIESACEPYGYHPLSLRILAGLIIDDREKPGDIAVANKINITDDIVANKNHVLKVAYDTLKTEQQNLLSIIACFRAPMTYDALKSISSKPSGKGKKAKTISTKELDDDLKVLEKRGLLHWDRKTNKYDHHPIVRRYAYERLTTSDRSAAHKRLIIYFEVIPTPPRIEKLEDLAPVIELYHHIVRAGQLDDAALLLNDRLSEPIYFQFCAYQLYIELATVLFTEGIDNLPPLKSQNFQEAILGDIANSYLLSGQPHISLRLITLHNEFCQKIGDSENLAVGLSTMAANQEMIGALHAAASNLSSRVKLCQDIQNEGREVVGHQQLGDLLSYRGAWQEAKQELDLSFNYDTKQNDYQGLSVDWSSRALRFLLMARAAPELKITNLKSAIEAASRALELADKTTKISYPHPRDYVLAYWLLGAAYRGSGDLTKAEENLSRAISMCRQINVVEDEADILLDLARLRYDQKNYEEAKSLADEALLITERCGYVLQGADVNLLLAQYALEQEKDKAKAKACAETALKLATCDGPPYYYKVAYEEAERMLAGL